ncbi:ceramide synthase 5 isoform X2 [Manduca sexta]|uniref:TLC domain-containing protein n=2 Tax=Manduca sexta TaxID=7130 RepID=A0A921YVK5_MANSE|nr:ceramide synthase 5 isoform X2 [Manduca sexta]XP_030021923.1 ceramide synthase 5 isoform X2 [Manduca sexta]XP_030021924.1 ceramide synthase 5 isoform X2 [Manduca sexta]KAG6446774.1 hypothetical protein O3G_MSEX004582 [Manduca sexta]KAG6446775.1 hypothetical protein O3G_MSEX004582 [Manduca sexta]KAG6446776.1 hypothetical protein O3G_MSEX004582 [Manduca sexta]KAG6446777.1 hypothetical protein O3G_MSEX004582 [Manduca sexta]
MSRISEWFWTESVWLPANVSWSDVTNAPGKSVVYSELNDFLYVLPFGAMIFFVRYLLERYCFIPLGRLLNIPEKNVRKLLHNDILETAFLASPKKANFSKLSKKVDMTERQVERWWRLRSNSNKPSQLVKFCESIWKFVFYIFVTLYGLYVLWDKEWFWNFDNCFNGYPHQGVTDDIRRYYMFQTANCWYLLIFQFRAVKRKDSWQMYVHHFAAISLLSISWTNSMYRIGTLVLVLHDCGDIALEAGKALKYAKYQNACNCTFVVFITVWIGTRIIFYPNYVIAISSEYAKTATMYYVLKAMLWMLFGLHLIWTWYILQIAYKAVRAGEVEGDVRSSDSEEIEISNHSD